ncbi:hypothetical protein [Dongia rigui]|uniref:Antifreeze protein n=1 Tax=Dongia rigui TaxID=940149 RepID=A0ABU5DW16_9PROT|nr:hypothetical protein [Dongia rigui]MDY0871500.1 hypothetical protein [Dongia rigui]
MNQKTWLRLGFDAMTLAVEAQTVIALRLMKIALGDQAALAESQLMVREKMEALSALQTRALTGWMGLSPQLTPRATVAHVRRKVRANQKRLSR